MLPERLLRYELDGENIVTHYMTPDDEGWLASLLEIGRRHVDLPRRDFEARLRDELPATAPRDAIPLAAHVTLGLCAGTLRSGVNPRSIRRDLFAERGRSLAKREDVVSRVAARLAITPGELDRCLLADLPSQRIVGRLPDELSARELMDRINLRLAQGFVARAHRVSLELEGHVRRVVQQATWQGLLCTVRGDDPARCRLDVSGPLAVLHATRLYARALASLVPVLPWCRRFKLEAGCRLRERVAIFRLDECDPIGRGVPPRRHDSRIEEAFEGDVRRLAPDWDVLREPQALPVAGTLVFPDFAIGPRMEPRSRVLVEIVGWWTRDYLETKLARLRAARCERLIICLEERAGRNVGSVLGLDVVTFRRRVDAGRILQRAREILSVPPSMPGAPSCSDPRLAPVRDPR